MGRYGILGLSTEKKEESAFSTLPSSKADTKGQVLKVLEVRKYLPLALPPI